ncbi:MAG: hypothetical protein ABI972_09885 [Acidobacteriota bacterium]
MALAFKMWKSGLRAIYPVLFIFLAFSSTALLMLEFLPRNTNLYAYAWLAVTPFHWVLYFGIAYEIYRRVLEEHKGIATAGRWVVTVGVVLATAVTGVTMLADLSALHQKYPILFAMHVTERAVSTALALLLLLLSVFLLYFPVLLRRNSLLIVTGLTIFFLFKTLLLLMRNLMGPETYLVLSAGNQVLYLVITATWLWRLIPSEADQSSGPRASVPKERAEEMLRRLGHMNEVLLRSGGR